MSPRTAQANVAQQLQANTFTRTGCGFAGWAENKDGTPSILTAGTSISGEPAGTTLTFYAQWTVTDPAAIVDEATSGGNTITLTDVAWSDIESALKNALSGGSITTLNLSGVSGLTAWNISTLNLEINDKVKITSMVLPDTVTTLTYQSSTGAFQGYDHLTSVRGKGVTDIGRNAFYGCTALTSLTNVDLPVAAKIGQEAFRGCTDLAEVSLSLVTDIGLRAFSECSKLASVSLPAATTIGNYAFEKCSVLASVYFQKAASIGAVAFNACTALTTVNLPAATKFGAQAFYDCKALAKLFLPAMPPVLSYEGQAGTKAFANTTNPSVPLNIYVGLDNVEAYKTAWSVNETTGEKGNTNAYGDDHKAINIMEVE
jgi:hypothetical protein